MALTLLAYIGFQRSGFDELLGFTRLELMGEEPWLVPATILSTTLVLLLPGAAVSGLLAGLGRPRAARYVFIALSSGVMFLIGLDFAILRSFGRHLPEIVQVALQPHGHVAGGELGSWGWMLAQWALVALGASCCTAFACERLIRVTSPRLTPLVGYTLHSATWLVLLSFVAAPHLMRAGWRNSALCERLHGAVLVDLRLPGAMSEDERREPKLRALNQRLQSSYRAAFPGLSAGKPADDVTIPLPARPPNVILIVTESLRHDVFSAELMPRLTGWAERGLVAAEHDAGTMYSESGLFALMYGRSPAVFHQTLDAGVPPQLCLTLRQSGYECAYFTGHPKVWQRREEFMNERTMDRFVHDDRGTWPEWDRRALQHMVDAASTATKPLLAVVLLMSSHFEYQYPPQYELDTPVANSAWLSTAVKALGPAAELPHRNRYRNCMRFIDDVVSDAVDQLDPGRNLIVFTGDHGESIYDDGRYTHGYSFAEIATRTPLAMVGPGVTPVRLTRKTLHVDLLPSVLHVLTGQRQQVAHTHGIDWFSGEERVSSLQAHSPPGGARIQAQLRAGDYRLRLDLDLKWPNVTVLGFEDALAQLQPTPELSEQGANELVKALEEQLVILSR